MTGSLEAKAKKLLSVLDEISESEFSDDEKIQEAKRLNNELAPAYIVLYGKVPLISTDYPTRIWWPRAREHASQALAAIQGGLVSLVGSEGAEMDRNTPAGRHTESSLPISAHEGDSPQTCFVIGPIGDPLSPYGSDGRRRYEDAIEILEKVIEPACAVFGIVPIRADQIQRSGEITDQVFRHLRDADLVIADVTGGNPNVMYELGLRHSRRHLTIQLGERERLPFDIQSIRTLQFARSESGLIEIRRRLEAAIRLGLEEGFDPVTAMRVFDSRAGFGGEDADNDDGGGTPPKTPPAPEPEPTSPGMLEKLAELEDTLPTLGEAVRKTNALLDEIARLAREAGERVESGPARESYKARLTLVTKLARDLDKPATDLKASADDFDSRLRRADPGIKEVLMQAEHGDVPAADMMEFLESIRFLGHETSGAMEAFNQLAGIVEGTKQISKAMVRPAGLIVDGLKKYLEASSIIEEWSTRASRLLEASETAASRTRLQIVRLPDYDFVVPREDVRNVADEGLTLEDPEGHSSKFMLVEHRREPESDIYVVGDEMGSISIGYPIPPLHRVLDELAAQWSDLGLPDAPAWAEGEDIVEHLRYLRNELLRSGVVPRI